MRIFAHENRLGRIALFLIYGWFGMLKALGLSPASSLVLALLHEITPWMNQNAFVFWFGLFEVLIGTAFLVVGARRWVVRVFFLHIVMTMAPLVVLPQETWSTWFVPTLAGQYIIKNLALIALVRFMVKVEKMGTHPSHKNSP